METSLNRVSINLSWRHHSTRSQSICHGDITQPCLNQFAMEKTSLNPVSINLSWRPLNPVSINLRSRHHSTLSQSICHGEDITQPSLNQFAIETSFNPVSIQQWIFFMNFLFSQNLLPFHKVKKASSIQCGYRKFKTHTLVLIPTLVNENSKMQDHRREEEGMQSECRNT